MLDSMYTQLAKVIGKRHRVNVLPIPFRITYTQQTFDEITDSVEKKERNNLHRKICQFTESIR